MKQFNMILLCIIATIVIIPKTNAQEIQLFGPGVHQDLDYRIETRSICVPNPTLDLEYDFGKTFSENVNDAIRRERTAFKNTRIGNYVHPQHYTDPVDYAHKIITALRKAYSEAYDIKVIDVPLDISVTNAAQNHSCKMISCNEFTHQSACTGSPRTRLSAQVGDWGTCLMGYSENIAINTSSTIEAAIEWAIFGMMYDDLACCRNGHRENFLKCTYDASWRMGFGYQKGKYSFGSNRSYDAWFMTWDYAKMGKSTLCSWGEDKGAKSCPSPAVVAIQNLNVQGQGTCSSLEVSWTTNKTDQVRNLEVYLSVDGKPFSVASTVSPQSGEKYKASFNANGKEAKIFVKANTIPGSFFSSAVSTFNLTDCTTKEPEEEPENPQADNGTTDEVKDNVPAPQPDPQPEPDPDRLVISPNPAKTYIRLAGANFGSIYRIYNMDGKIALIGIYHGQLIQLSRLKAGTYVIQVGDKSGQFVKI